MAKEEVKETEVSEVENKEFNINIKITNKNLSYKSDFSEPETIFWLESIKSIIIQKAFEQSSNQA